MCASAKGSGPRRWCWVAAVCLVLAAAGAGLWWAGWADHDAPQPSSQQEPPLASSELPMLELGSTFTYAPVSGIEHVFSLDELANGSPWRPGDALDTLPVFENFLYENEKDWQAMRGQILQVAQGLGIGEDALLIGGDTPETEAQQAILDQIKGAGGQVPVGYFSSDKLVGLAEGVTIEVDAALTVTVRFDPAVELPEGHDFSPYAPYASIQAAAAYLKEAYAGLIGQADPRADIRSTGYDYYLRQQHALSFYEGSGSLTDQILACEFGGVTFTGDEEGRLWSIQVRQPDYSCKVGDYPVITPDEAAELLEKGGYITNVPYDFPGREAIGRVELGYRPHPLDRYLIPYYRFLVKVEEGADYCTKDGQPIHEDTIGYGAYYVPAVDPAYIPGMPALG